jgi:hypothetical protein
MTGLLRLLGAFVDAQERFRTTADVKNPLGREKATLGAKPGPLLWLGLPGVGSTKLPRRPGSPRTQPYETSGKDFG